MGAPSPCCSTCTSNTRSMGAGSDEAQPADKQHATLAFPRCAGGAHCVGQQNDAAAGLHRVNDRSSLQSHVSAGVGEHSGPIVIGGLDSVHPS